MGKRRESDMVKIDAFVTEMNQYGHEHHGDDARKFTMAKKARLNLINIARERKCSIESVIDEFRPGVQKMILEPESGNILPKEMPSLN
jgi:hypothetical protein